MSTEDRRIRQERFELQLARALLAQKLLTAEGLEEAIRQQVVLGGHLATNLWELGLVSGSKLSHTSARLLEVPLADPRVVALTSEPILHLLPRDFVQRARLIPFRVEGSVLQVATSEPWDLPTLGEAAYESGYPVEPHFLAEVPLMALLAKLYYISPGTRFGRGVQAQKNRTQEPPKPQPKVIKHFTPAVGTSATTVSPAAAPTPIQPQKSSASLRQVAPPRPIADLKEAQKLLDQAETRDAIGAVLLRFALSRGRRTALLVVRGEDWHGWLGAGSNVDPLRIRSLIVPHETKSIFTLVASTGGHHLGPLADNIAHAALLEALAYEDSSPAPPRSAALLPVHMSGRLIFGIYIDGGPGKLVSPKVAEVMGLAHQVPAALTRVVRKQVKQRMGSDAWGQD